MTVIFNTYFVEKKIADEVENLFLFSFDFPWFIRAGQSTSGHPLTGEEYDDSYAPTLTNVPDVQSFAESSTKVPLTVCKLPFTQT